jgi:hypothetical protein
MSFLDRLSVELAAVGIVGAQRHRILAEVHDHLACDSQAALGEPREIAERFADELGTGRARRAALTAFAALAVAGVLYVAVFVSAGAAGPRASSVYAEGPLIGYLTAGLVLLCPQLAFVAGGLGVVRAFRGRRQDVLPRSEAVVLLRRAGVGICAGLATMAGLAIVSVEFTGELASWWTTFALVASAAGAATLAAATPALISSRRLLPISAGEAADIFDDLGRSVPTPLRGRPWAFALGVAAAVAAVTALAGAAAADGIDGALRGAAEALACLAGFGLLGRYLSLRQDPVSER